MKGAKGAGGQGGDASQMTLVKGFSSARLNY